MVTTLRTGSLRNRGSIPGRRKRLLLESVQTDPGADTASCSETGSRTSGIKAARA
jgi:hypothetical protein